MKGFRTRYSTTHAHAMININSSVAAPSLERRAGCRRLVGRSDTIFLGRVSRYHQRMSMTFTACASIVWKDDGKPRKNVPIPVPEVFRIFTSVDF